MKYGQTWWGEQWLNALSYIDYSNRLPRGRTYANKGAVQFVNFDDNTITADVAGSRRKPYEVTISVPAFSESEKKILIDNILTNPLLLSKLLNRNLPKNLNQIARKNNINIFPKKWDDFTMHCSCPDWAVPCKHLAAVINVVANEIDRNPFLIFKLHKFDIVKTLQSKGFNTIREKVFIPSTASFNGADNHLVNTLEELSELEHIDFSTIGEMREKILALLGEKPLFYPKDFKVILARIYLRSAKNIQSSLKKRLVVDDSHDGNYEKYQIAEIYFKNEIDFSTCKIHTSTDTFSFSEIGTLISFLETIPAKAINKLPSGLLFLYFVFHFSQKLIEKSAFIPQLLELTDGCYIIRWLPVLINDEVHRIFESLLTAYPSSLFVAENPESNFTAKENVQNLISFFIKDLIKNAAYSTITHSDRVSDLFFTNQTYKFNKLGEKEIPATIQQWIESFYITQNKYIPLLEVSEIEDSGLFQVNVLIENTNKPFDQPLLISSVMNDKQHVEAKIEILRNLDLLTQSFPALENVIISSGKDIPVFNSDEFAEVLFNIIPVVKLYGIKVILPKTLKNLVRPKLTVSLSSNNSTQSKSFFKLDEMLNFKWEVAIGDILMTKDEFLDLVEGFSGIVKLQHQYVYLNDIDLKILMNNINKQESLNRYELLQTAISGEYNGATINIDEHTKKLINDMLKVNKLDLPDGLNANLRPYQQRGYEWLFKNSQLGFGSIIADDMGLGKTIQVIAMILKLKNEGLLQKQKVLIVVPTTLITNWQKEIDKFAPQLTYSVYHGAKRKLNTECDVVISSYGMIRSDVTILNKQTWKTLVIDEAQNIKNHATAQTKAVKKLKSGIRIAMSGTPVENRLTEYWSIFDFVNKGYLGNIKTFVKDFATPIEVYRNGEKLDRFLKITSPFILRRLKSDKSIINDLPEKIENDYFASLSKEQTAIYQNVLDEIMDEIEGVNVQENDANIKRRGLVLKLIIALKQICNHPVQFLKKGECVPSLSGKASLFINLLENIYEANEKVIIFTQFKEMGILLQKMISDRFETEAMFLHGGTSRKKRDQMVEDFQNDLHKRIFILSIKAGGTGLNLTAANHVIHYDLWWNPAVESQATDRAYRIGQNKNVMVYRLITKGTFEEKINQMLNHKKELADLTVSSGEKWIGELPNSELKELFTI